MIPRPLVPIAVLALAGCAPSPAPVSALPGGLLLADRFDGENNGIPAVGYENFRHWTAAHASLLGDRGGEGLAVSLGGSAGALTSRATFDLVPAVYQLSFRVAGSDVPGTLAVRLGEWSTRVDLPAPGRFREEVHTIRIQRRVRARLSFRPEGAAGARIDDVVLRRIAE